MTDGPQTARGSFCECMRRAWPSRFVTRAPQEAEAAGGRGRAGAGARAEAGAAPGAGPGPGPGAGGEAGGGGDSSDDDALPEFRDPILMTRMRDPVLLPDSRVAVDRATLARLAAACAADPFTRAPLRAADALPAAHLAARIAAWRAGRRK